mmetsp:Transcript_16980/g.54454  ORF Transcript_16980/g.54454 Transcript_16980/m.54454 type:complete len:217 (-) Transcript_16980:1131-1781(-)
MEGAVAQVEVIVCLQHRSRSRAVAKQRGLRHLHAQRLRQLCLAVRPRLEVCAAQLSRCHLAALQPTLQVQQSGDPVLPVFDAVRLGRELGCQATLHHALVVAAHSRYCLLGLGHGVGDHEHNAIGELDCRRAQRVEGDVLGCPALGEARDGLVHASAHGPHELLALPRQLSHLRPAIRQSQRPRRRQCRSDHQRGGGGQACSTRDVAADDETQSVA